MSIHGSFRFHNVGQGLFYSGLLNIKESSKHGIFSFVYDCGTNSPMSFLQREIDDYKLLLKTAKAGRNKKLDLLVISHLHDDHVNGLEYLLKNVDVDTVVMPYASEDLNFMARLESESDSDFLRTFYIDPVGWFVSRGVRRIFLLGSEEWFEGENSLSAVQGEREEPDIDVQGILHIENIDETKIVHLKNNANIYYKSIFWTFHFVNLNLEFGKVNSYKQVVNDFLQNNNLTLEQLFKSKLYLSKLKQNIKAAKLNSILNRTSVVLLHEPVCGGMHVQNNMRPYKDCNYCARCILIKSFDDPAYRSTILTGDINLKVDETLKELDVGSNYRCLVLQYPHHGAKNDGMDYFQRFNAYYNVISYGIVNQYGHPCKEVLKKVSNLVFVTEREAFDYQIII